MSFKRSSRLVRSRVQRAVLTRFILHWAALAATFFGTVFSLHYFLGNPVDPVSSILHQMWQRYSLLVVVSCALLPYFLYDLVKLTHRFAGPMVRFGDALHRAAQGEAVEPITFRDGDYWHEMAEDLNTMLARCRPSGQAGPAKERITEKSESDTEESAELVSA